MTFTLGKNVKEGQKIKTRHGWRKIITVHAAGVKVKEGNISYGATIYGWRAI